MKKLMYIPLAVGVLAFGGIALANSQTSTEVKNDTEKVSTEKLVGIEEISAKSLERANGNITDIELDMDDKKAHYEVEVDFDGYEYDFDFDAYTGEVIEETREKKDADDAKESTDTIATEGLISSDQAIAVALEQVNGTFDGFELKTKNGIAYYEIEVQDGTIEHEIEVDAKDGAILKIESDDEDEDEDDVDDDDRD
ncbi:PepSY domain-containing protein [Planococcus versutus]|uniref:PepSY domain-containing protein n=1 Tax=Planococcus versutus TaxID=1302659 RepID=A0A1B1S3N4_9BACL|nr:PepSY domain-containing protein [Planococcus versutus]ANU27798.1 hypothetical protein I858_012470 [Planococcus versutus]